MPLGSPGRDERTSKDGQNNPVKPAFTTELFLDNAMIEVTPGVSRRIHKPKKHLLNPVVGCDRWCEGNNIQPYTTMYDSEDKLFKMWARAGSDWKSRFLTAMRRTCSISPQPTASTGISPISVWRRSTVGAITTSFSPAIWFPRPIPRAPGEGRDSSHRFTDEAPGQEGLLLVGEQAPQPQKREREVRRPGDCSRSSAWSAPRHVSRRDPLVLRQRPLLADAERCLRRRETTA